MSFSITEADLFEALYAAAGGTAPPEARTMEEIRRDTGIGEKRLRRAMKKLRDAGRLQVHDIMRRDLANRRIVVPGYTISPAKKRK